MNMARKEVIMSREGCPVDPVLAGTSVALLAFGIVMVASASTEVAARLHGDSMHLLARHLLYVAVAGGAAMVTLLIPVSFWQRSYVLLAIASFLLLAAVLVPGVGREVNGAVRWIPLGFFNLQGSEFVKLFVVVYLAGYLASRETITIRTFVQPGLILLGLVLLLLGQPDFGASVVIVAAAFGVIFLAGTSWRYLGPFLLLGIIGFVGMVFAEPYRLARLFAFADPWAQQYGSGYQLTQALIAFGRGEWFGLGLGNSIQKLFFLPEAHTDFLFSIIAEELGLLGASVVVMLFLALVLRAVMLGHRAFRNDQLFHALLAFGIALLIGVQALINLGVNMGVLPTKGLTLPLMSYGGNSLIVSCILIAILLRIEMESRVAPPRGRGGRSS